MEITHQVSPQTVQKGKGRSFAHDHDNHEPEEMGKVMHPPVFQLFAGSEDAPASGGNETGMPDSLKTGLEQLSGMDMSDVRVHYSSGKPAEVGALAYAQGADIHIAPGHDYLLAHEAWHVVQQKQGRVAANTQVNGLGVNDDSTLEREADVMGAKAMEMQADGKNRTLQQRKLQGGPVQRVLVQIVPKVKKPEPSITNTTLPTDTTTPPQPSLDITMTTPQTNEPLTDTLTIPPTSVNDNTVTTDKNKMEVDDKPQVNTDQKVPSPEEKKMDNGIPLMLFQHHEPSLIIGQVHIVGRPAKLFTNSMGDHTTAFGVHVAGIKAGIKNKNVIDAWRFMHELGCKVEKCEGYEQGLSTQYFPHKYVRAQQVFWGEMEKMEALIGDISVYGTEAEAIALLYLQKCIQAYLEYREQVPLSAINVAAKSPALAGKTKGEAKYIQLLQEWEEKRTTPSKHQLEECVLGTFDPQAVAMALSEADTEMVLKMVPGLNQLSSISLKVRIFANNHLQTLQMNFIHISGSITKYYDLLTDALVKGICIATIDRASIECGQHFHTMGKLKDEHIRVSQNFERDKPNLNQKLKIDSLYNVPVTEKNFVVDTKKDLQKKLKEKQNKQSNKKRKVSPPPVTVGKDYDNQFLRLEQLHAYHFENLKIKESTIMQCGDLLSQPYLTGYKMPDNLDDYNGIYNDIQKSIDRISLEGREEEQLDKEERCQQQATMITYSVDETIHAIEFAGRPKSPHPNTMGAHTTAWIVYQDWIRNSLKSKTVIDAVELVNGDLSRFMQEHEDHMLKALGQAITKEHLSLLETAKTEFLKYGDRILHEPKLMQKLMLQQYINLFLAYINMIPGTTIDKSDTSGKKERTHCNQIRTQTLLGNEAPDDAVTGLLDLEDLPNEFEGKPAQNLRDHHKWLIKKAYPVSPQPDPNIPSIKRKRKNKNSQDNQGVQMNNQPFNIQNFSPNSFQTGIQILPVSQNSILNQDYFIFQNDFGLQYPFGNQNISNNQNPFGSQYPFGNKNISNNQNLFGSQHPFGNQNISNNQNLFGSQHPIGNQNISNNQSLVGSQHPTKNQSNSNSSGFQYSINNQIFNSNTFVPQNFPQNTSFPQPPVVYIFPFSGNQDPKKKF